MFLNSLELNKTRFIITNSIEILLILWEVVNQNKKVVNQNKEVVNQNKEVANQNKEVVNHNKLQKLLKNKMIMCLTSRKY